jgi:hypothetical protein
MHHVPPGKRVNLTTIFQQQATAIMYLQHHSVSACGIKHRRMVLNTWLPTLKSFTFPGGHEVAPPPVILDAMRWLKATTVFGKRLSSGKRHIAELDRV